MPSPLFGVEACFGNIFVWRKSWDIKIAHDEQALYLLLENDDPSFMLPPFLKDEKADIGEAVEKCEEYMKQVYGDTASAKRYDAANSAEIRKIQTGPVFLYRRQVQTMSMFTAVKILPILLERSFTANATI